VDDARGELLSKVPKGMSISRLLYKDRTLILLGVKRRTMIHASYVYDFLEASKAETIFIQQAPDVPLFIKTKSTASFNSRWFQFVRKGKEARFYVSSLPQYTSDLLLNDKKLRSLME
jgi:hypothetical protein